MIKLQNVATAVTTTEKDFITLVSSVLHINSDKIKEVKLYKRSVDARKKPNIYYCDTFLVDLKDIHTEKAVLKKNKNAVLFTEKPYIWKKAINKPDIRPVIVGSGPAGLFAALTLCRAGIPPIIIERGEPIEQRVRSVESFWNGGTLNPNSNVQFGEGGAGTFSDGKLNTGIKDPRCRTVLEQFHAFGANEDILIKAKPHIGTDVLRDVVINIRKEIESLGGEYRFNTEFLSPIIKNNALIAAMCEDKNGKFEINCNNLILAIGNAARSTYKSLFSCGITIIPKPFAIGMRIEHLQSQINLVRYGENPSPLLGAADYKLATHLKSGRGVYSFCMCPGGVVVNSASENETYVTNGMSYQSRSEKNANSALLVGITEADFSHLGENTPFGGIALQEQIEKAAFSATGGKGLPVQTVGNFLKRTKDNCFGKVMPTVLPNYFSCDIDNIFPSFITDSIREALPLFDGQISGFADNGAVLTAPETRSSSPVRILRNDAYCSNISGIYPCGEGAGYAGGITSSAVDGIRCAEAIIENFR